MITLVREIKANEAILGRLYLNGAFVCYTLENAAKAIPCGMYNVQNSKSPKFKRELPLLWNSNVPAIRGIRIHVGNDAVKDSSGCVLVGMGRNGDRLTESTPAETMVTMLCRNVAEVVITEVCTKVCTA
ncbi:MAG: hypothetical protein J6W54_04205 [Fibrobacter sp.]|uniref:DUF5675 family protein n=1 Tax=Fibrobacter sp. TaxID=35828 RepID=UPI001B2E0994|nr:DUF5675 family protein [Fibrobacter sp.]MBO7060284.1 hypothetical protein [Fibrobacter sp.]